MNTGKFTAEKLAFTLFEGAGEEWDLRMMARGTVEPDYLEGCEGVVGPGGWADREPGCTVRDEDWLLEGGARVVQMVSFTRRAPANLVAARAAWNARPGMANKHDVAVVREALDEAALPNPALVPLWQVDSLVGIGCTGHRADELARQIAFTAGCGGLARWGGDYWLSKIVLAGTEGSPLAGAPVYPTGRKIVVENTDGDTETLAAGGGRRAERLLERMRVGERVARAGLSMVIDYQEGQWVVSWTAGGGNAAEASGWTARPPVGVEAEPGARLAVWRAWADAWRAALAALESVSLPEMLAAGTEP